MTQFGLFLFTGTFSPPSDFPVPLQVLIEATPLYHGVTLLRAITTGRPDWTVLWHVGYLVALAAVGLTMASRRMGILLLK